ncbi:phosphatidate cytidylyltransferase [Luteipulveratus flavus]|uniref:Phosphatidate cytidylyltransferase n=1 Tax=Luteipulveratus flavus TaxID=3031728 RepID=A0ABT6CB65_9MICO|nr:phosphatidate cytidylyltransferase [Luteipulveratus sp. YIM 133296]MDF8266135.1 phosphatidate cytidylyltransferase [Luteipulveratus sp. YIM 133296]
MEQLTLTATVLTVGGVATHLSGNPVLRERWRTWLVAAPVVLVPMLLLGSWGPVLLAAGLGVVAAAEYGRLTGLRPSDGGLLVAAVVAAPVLARLDVGSYDARWLALTPLAIALPALLGGDAAGGFRRVSALALGALWLVAGLLPLVLLDPVVVVSLCLAVATADVGAWCAGRALGRRGPLSRPLSPHSPSKTWAGVLGSLAGAALVLTVLGEPSWPLLVAATVGSVLGDLLESLVKRGCGRKDAGTWLPGFGGLLDRVDSLLVALPVALVLVGGA